MIKAILTPEDTHIEFDIPLEYVGKRVEISWKPIEDNKKKIKMSEFWGIISNETAKSMHEEVKRSRQEWERDI
jgi:hypothetical protein